MWKRLKNLWAWCNITPQKSVPAFNGFDSLPRSENSLPKLPNDRPMATIIKLTPKDPVEAALETVNPETNE